MTISPQWYCSKSTPAGVAIFEFKRDAPWPIHMDRITRRPEASQSMEIKTGDVHFFRPHGNVQAIQAT
jgi:hypothetical protein